MLDLAYLARLWQMTESNASHAIHENLDTAYTNLAALVRYLQGRGFVGRIHVVMAEYEADVILNGKNPPLVRDTDHAKQRSGESEEALRRIYVRASEAGGLITVYEWRVIEPVPLAAPAAIASIKRTTPPLAEVRKPEENSDRREVLEIVGQLIAAVQRAANGFGADFQKAFDASRVELADDFSFLDPTTTDLSYNDGMVQLKSQVAINEIVSGITECLRRTANAISKGPRERTHRERVALELALLVRRRQPLLEKHNISKQLDRIAGTRVL